MKKLSVRCLIILLAFAQNVGAATDTTKPVVTINSSTYNGRNATFTFSAVDANGIAGYSCQMDTAAYVACTSPKAYSNLPNGSHTFRAKATDLAGNSAFVTRTFTVAVVADTTKPTVTITLKPAATITTKSATFAYTATDNAGGSGINNTKCKMDTAALAACTSPKTFSALANGSHTYSVVTYDNANNASPQVNYTFTVATTAAKVPQHGHYLSFAEPINLKEEVTNVLDNPAAYTTTQKNKAKDIDEILRSPGIKGIWTPFYWFMVETVDTPLDDILTNDRFDWSYIDANLAVAKRYGLRLVTTFSDRTFKNLNAMPPYFPPQYVLEVDSLRSETLGGYVSKRWDPYVNKRMIRLLKALGARYDSNPNFEGVANSESAIGQLVDPNTGYNGDTYKNAIINLVNSSKVAFPHSTFFLYLNFVEGVQKNILDNDGRVEIIDAVASPNVGFGGPDVMADDSGHATGLNSIYIRAKNEHPTAPKFCHAQFNDQKQLKTNQFRLKFFNDVGRYGDDILRNLAGTKVSLHPDNELDTYWTPQETFTYGRENFNCNYFFWHYKTGRGKLDAAGHPEYITRDILPLINANQNF